MAAPFAPGGAPPLMAADVATRPVPGAAGQEGENPCALQARDLSLWYGAHQALYGISIEVQERRITAIIGPSGCGKSSLIRCFNRMNDLYPPIRYDGSLSF